MIREMWLRSCGRLVERLRPFYLRLLLFRLFPSAKPRSFSHCWDYPYLELESDSSALLPVAPAHGELPDVLFLPMTDWHNRIQRTQQLAMALAALGHRCFILNPQLGRQFPAIPVTNRPSRISFLARRIIEVHIALPSEPVFHHRLLAPAESERLTSELAQVLRRAGVSQLVMVASLPTWNDCAGLLRKDFSGLSVYDCHDWLAGFSNMSPEIVAREPEALEHFDVVLFSSQRLQEEFGRLAPATLRTGVLLRNGVPAWPPNAGPRVSEKVVGYVGAIEDWFDSDILESVARALPGVRFRLAGRAPAGLIRRFRRMSNVEFLGEVRHQDLPDVLATFRAAIIPFRPTRLIHFTDPIKIYEYFHFGLPVVTTCSPDCAEHAELVYYGATAQEFERAIVEALAEDGGPSEAKRRQLAGSATWTIRGRQLSDLISRRALSAAN